MSTSPPHGGAPGGWLASQTQPQTPSASAAAAARGGGADRGGSAALGSAPSPRAAADADGAYAGMSMDELLRALGRISGDDDVDVGDDFEGLCIHLFDASS